MHKLLCTSSLSALLSLFVCRGFYLATMSTRQRCPCGAAQALLQDREELGAARALGGKQPFQMILQHLATPAVHWRTSAWTQLTCGMGFNVEAQQGDGLLSADGSEGPWPERPAIGGGSGLFALTMCSQF